MSDAWTSFDSYQSFTRTTARYPAAGTGSEEAIAYCALKLAGETGEVTEKLGKLTRHRGSITSIARDNISVEDREALAKELGDVLWYIAGLASEYGYNLSDVAKLNVEKLSSRQERGTLFGSGDNR